MAPKVIPNLVQGVTQQSPQQARDSQCRAQFDCINAASEGAAARPASELVKAYPGRNLAGSYFSETDHEDENYLVGITAAGVPFAIDLADGTDCTMTQVVSPTYLQAGTKPIPQRLRAQVAEDHTFVVNREVAPAMTGTVSAAKVNEVLVFVRATQLGVTYALDLIGIGSPVSVSINTHATNVTATSVIAQLLVDAINLNTGTHGYTAARNGSTLRITHSSGGAFRVDTTDGNGDDSMLAFNGTATSYEKLPARGFTGMILKVSGEDKSADDDYYVKFEGDPSTGQWVETVGPSTKTTLDATTMPHAIKNVAYRSFEYLRMTWSTRIAGDGVVTSKDPEFVGKKPRDIFYHQRRLALLHASGAVFSKADASFTFFPDTVQTQLDDAPVDVKTGNSNGKGATSLDFAVQVAERLYLWGPRQQHVVDHGNEAGFSQKTVGTDESTSYEYSPLVDPMPMGPFLYFCTEVGQYANFRALQFQQARFMGDLDLSAHVPSYIPAGVKLLTGAETLRMIFMLSDGAPSNLYLFNFLWDGQQFAQQAFNTWRLPGGDILWASVRSNYLRILQQRPEGVVLLKVNLTPKITDGGSAKYQTRLDLRVDEDGVTGLTYNSTTDRTSFTLPYAPTGADVRVVTRTDKPGGKTRGRVFELVSVVGAVVTVKGDLTGYEFYVGQRITAEREENEWFIRTENGSEPTDSLTVNKWSYSLSDSGYSRLEVDSANGSHREYEFQARVLGTPSAQTGTPIIGNGDVSGEVGHASKDVTIKIVNDSFLPSYWQNAAVEYTAVGWKGHK